MFIPENTKIWAAIRCRQKINGDSAATLAKQLEVRERTIAEYEKTDGENITLGQISHYCKVNKVTMLQLLQSAELLTSAA